LLDPTLTTPRVAYAIGRAVGTATTRNRLRRRLRAILHELAPELPPAWLLISATPTAVELTFDQLRTEVRALLTTLPRPTPTTT
jgi:ribonuclease P protein component